MNLEPATLQPVKYVVTQQVGYEVQRHQVEGYGSFFVGVGAWHLLAARFGRLEIKAMFNNVLSVEEVTE